MRPRPPHPAGNNIRALTDTDKMPFGKHKGEKMINVPPEYLMYIFDMPWIKDWPAVEKYIDENFDAILKEDQDRKNLGAG